jgi:L-ascorbate metabolism protein UlaG (beta-lactamase superfamily)
MKITYLGHAAVKVEVSNKTIYIDPFLSGNPKAPITADQITSADIIIITHDHGDHLGDAFAIAKRTNAWIVSQYEITVLANENGIQKVEPMNIGGPISVEGIKIALTPAWHTSQTGGPTGIIIQALGKTLYHAGDTGLFSDMKLIGELYKPDIALLPIGGRFTMDIYQAAKAVEFIRPKYVIPIHYNTFDLIKADPQEFKKLVGNLSQVIILEPGETFNY